MKSFIVGNIGNTLGTTVNAASSFIGAGITATDSYESQSKILEEAESNILVSDWTNGVESRGFENIEIDLLKLEELPISDNMRDAMSTQLMSKYRIRSLETADEYFTDVAGYYGSSSTPQVPDTQPDEPVYWNLNTGVKMEDIGESYKKTNYSVFGTDYTYFGISTNDVISGNIGSTLSLDEKDTLVKLSEIFNDASTDTGVDYKKIIDKFGQDYFIDISTESFRILNKIKTEVGAGDSSMKELLDILNMDGFGTGSRAVEYFGAEFISTLLSLLTIQMASQGPGYDPDEWLRKTILDEIASEVAEVVADAIVKTVTWLWEDGKRYWFNVIENINAQLECYSKLGQSFLPEFVQDNGLVDWNYQIENNYDVMTGISQSYTLGYKHMIEFRVEDGWWSFPKLKIKTIGHQDSSYVDLAKNGEYNFGKKVNMSFSTHDNYRGNYEYLLNQIYNGGY